ncbi:MAG: hypothetical protein ABSA26_18560 [Thermoguttaceae bacterium]
MSIRFLMAIYVLFYAVSSADAQVIGYPYGLKSSAGTAQQRQQQLQQQQQAMTMLDVSGTIEALAAGRIQMRTNSNEQWMIVLNQQTKVQVTGEVGADFLRPGLFVQLKADVDKRGVAADKIEQLTIVTPSQEKTSGNFSHPAGPGQKPDGFEGGGASGFSTVQGRIISFKKNKLQLKIDKGTVLCELSDNPKIHIDLADYSMARKGDRIKVQGMKTTGANGMIQAAQVKIELAEQLGEKKKK